MIMLQPSTNADIDRAVGFALVGDVRDWPFPDEYMDKFFLPWAAAPDPVRAAEIKQLGHDVLAWAAQVDQSSDPLQVPSWNPSTVLVDA